MDFFKKAFVEFLSSPCWKKKREELHTPRPPPRIFSLRFWIFLCMGVKKHQKHISQKKKCVSKKELKTKTPTHLPAGAFLLFQRLLCARVAP
jgi:hypothetical protein